VIKNGDKKNIN